MEVTTSAPSDLDPNPELPQPWSAMLYLGDLPLDIRTLVRSPIPWGALPLDASADELCAAIRALAAGLVVASGPLLAAAGPRTLTQGTLTERETEILGLLAKGLANKQIALQLGISEHTVKFHISSIYAKLNATSRTQAVREGLRSGLIAL